MAGCAMLKMMDDRSTSICPWTDVVGCPRRHLRGGAATGTGSGVITSGETQSPPSHISKMVLSTVKIGPPKGIRTGCLTVRRICSLIQLFRWLVIWSSRSRISPLNLDSIQLDCPRSTAKFRCYCLTDRKLLPSPMEHREAAQQTFAMSPCRLVAPGTAPLGAS